MLLWDLEMESERQDLERLTLAQRLSVAVKTIVWTVDTLPEPVATNAVRAYLSEGLRLAQQAVQSGQIRVTLPRRLVDQYESVDAQADEPGTSHFLEALMVCSEAESGLDPDQLFGVLSFCYEGSLDREGLDEWSPDIERQNQRCLNVISYQKSLIHDALGGA